MLSTALICGIYEVVEGGIVIMAGEFHSLSGRVAVVFIQYTSVARPNLVWDRDYHLLGQDLRPNSMCSDIFFVPGTMSQFSSPVADRTRRTDSSCWPIHVTPLEEWYSEHPFLYLKRVHGSIGRWWSFFDLSKRTEVRKGVLR
jgi:hypothetical protein